MSQDTRKDPRAKVLTMTVRYKSATLDEFIEHHSYDVSRGGMFIKTPSPFPPGTLLKFEVKIAADQKVIQGVGRVVWKRDSETQADVRPAGMGVKFIKIDDASRKVIDTLVESRGDAASAYEAGGGDGGTPSAPVPAAASSKTLTAATEGAKAPNLRKSTMIGLGAMNLGNRPPAAATPAPAADDKPAASFFPETKSVADMPPPEDRTVMKQAAELLQDALRGAGGSMAEVGSSSKPAADSANAAPVSSAEPAATKTIEPAPTGAESKAEVKPEGKAVSEKPAAASTKPVSVKPAAAASVKATVPARKAGAVSAAPASRRVSVPAAAAAPSSGGGGRVVVIALVIAATGGLVYAFSSGNKPPEPAPAMSAEPTASAAPVASEEPAAPVVSASASAAPVDSVAPASSASASAAAPGSAAPVAQAPPVAPPVPAVPAPKPAPVLQARPVAKPKPVAAARPSEPSEPKAPSAPAAPREPTAQKPTMPPPAAAPTPAAPEAPAPKPKPVEPAGDNPY